MDLDLKVVWKYSLGKTQVGGGATLDSKGNIYFVTIDFSVDPAPQDPNDNGSKSLLTELNLYSLTNDGIFRWKRQISYNGEKWHHGMINCAISTEDTVYVGNSKLFAFDTVGNIKWQYPDNDTRIIGFSSSPIIDSADNVYFVSPEGVEENNEYGTDVIRAYKFSPISDGTPMWSTLLGNEIRENEGGNPNGGGGQKENGMLSSPAFGIGEKSLYAAVGNTINKVDTESGKLIWSFKPEGATGSFKSSPAVDSDDNIYLGTKSNIESNFYAIKSDGTLLWKRLIGADVYDSPLLGDDNKVYFGSETLPDGKFFALDMNTGETKWSIGPNNNIADFSFDSPLLYKGYIYIGVYSVTDSGNDHDALLKIKVDAYGYLPNAAWPRFHGGNDNSGIKK